MAVGTVNICTTRVRGGDVYLYHVYQLCSNCKEGLGGGGCGEGVPASVCKLTQKPGHGFKSMELMTLIEGSQLCAVFRHSSYLLQGFVL